MKHKRFIPQKWICIISVILFISLCFGWVGSAWADDTNASVSINGGTLHFYNVPNTEPESPLILTSVILDGTKQESLSHLPNFNVVDARGTGDGWSVQVKATQLTDSINSHTMPIGSLSLKEPGQINQKYIGTENIDPVIKSFGWLAIDGSSSQPIISAAINYGLGTWEINWGADPNGALKLQIDPGGVKVGNYKTTITWELAAPVDL